MGKTYRFIADPSTPSEVLNWFRSLPLSPTEVATPYGAALHFKQCGSLVYQADGKIDPEASPVATVFLPKVKRGVLWTVGEVRILATPIRKRYPTLYKIDVAFSQWLTARDRVFDNKRKDNEFKYYLEGSVQNHDAPVFAFESGILALRAGQYFVGESDSELRLDKLCKALRLRGVECA